MSPSLSLPKPNPVHHGPYILSTWDTFSLEAAPGSYVAIVQDGEVIGAGVAGPSGQATVPIQSLLRPAAMARLTVTAQNRQLYTKKLPVIAHETVPPVIARRPALRPPVSRLR